MGIRRVELDGGGLQTVFAGRLTLWAASKDLATFLLRHRDGGLLLGEVATGALHGSRVFFDR